MSADRIFLARAARNVEESPAYQPISKVRIIVGEDEKGQTTIFEAGSDSGRTIEVTNPWGTQDIADGMLAALQGYAYKPFSATGAILDPAAEIGDAVSVGDVYSVIAETETTFSPLMSANIGAREDSTIDHEYPYESPSEREITRAIAETKTSLIVETGKIAAEIETMNDPQKNGSLANKIAALTITTDDITAALDTQYLTSGEVATEISTAISLSEGRIKSTVSQTYQTKTQAQTDLAAAKGYADQKDSALQTAIQTAYESAITQSATEIQSTVARAIDKYDIASLPSNSGVIQEYGPVTNARYPAGQNAGKIYINLTTGEYWRSDGTYWRKYDNIAKTTTEAQNTKITQTAGAISTEVTDRKAADQQLQSMITQTATQIRAEVSGSYADEWSLYGENQTGEYTAGTIVKVTSTDSSDNVTGVTYYQCIQDHVAWTNTQPGVGTNWRLYWEVTNAPTVQSLVNIGLNGISLSFSDSALPNTVAFTLNKGGATITGTLHVANVEADSITAYASLTSPVINGGVFHNASGGGMLELANSGNYGDLILSGYNPNTQSSWEVFRVYDDIGGSVRLYGYGHEFMYVDSYTGEVNPKQVWDFSACSRVIMPDGTTFVKPSS